MRMYCPTSEVNFVHGNTWRLFLTGDQNVQIPNVSSLRILRAISCLIGRGPKNGHIKTLPRVLNGR